MIVRRRNKKRKSLKLIQRISLKIIKIKTVHLNLVVIMNFRRLIHKLKILIHQNSNLNLTKIIVKIRTMLHLIKATTRHRSLEACLHLMEMKVKHYNNFQILKQPQIQQRMRQTCLVTHIKNIMTTPSRLLMMDLDMYLALKMPQKTIVIQQSQ